MADHLGDLEADFCPPLDTSLVLAIVSDFDLNEPSAIAEVRATLEEIKLNAEAEQAAVDFQGPSDADHSNLDHADGSSQPGTATATTEIPDLSTGFSKLNHDNLRIDDEHPDVGAYLETLDLDSKCAILEGIIPDISHFTIQHTLTKCNLNLHRALDELMNIASIGNGNELSGDEVISKGIDAFSSELVSKRGRKKKRKGANHKISLDDRRTVSVPSSPMQGSLNVWQTHHGDVDFLSSHTKLSKQTIQSAYDASNASIPKTIARLLDEMSESAMMITSNDPTVLLHAQDLGREFPGITPSRLTAIIQLTHPSIASARILAQALLPPPVSTSSTSIIPQYKSFALSLSDDEVSTPYRPTRTKISSTALSHRQAHALLSAQAAQAYRRSRSNPLFGGAAAYYSSQAREAAASAAAASSAEADAQVMSQSSSRQLDLHGVVVADAVRIAKRETRKWWDGLEEKRATGKGGEALSIIVGKGTHSEGGKSRIGPAVVKALSGDGWKVESGGGVVAVTGRARR